MINDLDFAPSTQYIQLDLFPATLYRGTHGQDDNELIAIESRVIVTNDYIYAILIGPEGTYFALKEELVQFDQIPKVGYQVAGAHFDYLIIRDGNCGCGSRLRGMRFLSGVGHIAQNTTLKQR